MLSEGSAPRRLRELLPTAQVFPPASDPVASRVVDDAGAIRPGDVYIEIDGFDCTSASLAASRGAAAVITERLLPEVSSPQLIVADSWAAKQCLSQAGLVQHEAPAVDLRDPQLICVAGADDAATLSATILALAGQPTALRTPTVDDDGEVCTPLLERQSVPVSDWLGRAANNHMAVAVLASPAGENLAVPPPQVACLVTLQGASSPDESPAAARTAIARALGPISTATTLVVNADEPECVRLAATHPGPVITFGEAEHADVRVSVCEEHATGQRILVTGGNDTVAVDLDRPGTRRRREATASLAVALATGLETPASARSLQNAAEPVLHLDRLCSESSPIVLADAANHAPHLRETLASIDRIAEGRIFVVATLAAQQHVANEQLAVLESLSDRAFTTGGAEDLEFADPSVTPLADREGAIAVALGLAEPDDVVVITGMTPGSRDSEEEWVRLLIGQRTSTSAMRRAA